MKVFRLCDSKEIEYITAFKNPKMLGEPRRTDPNRSTHLYEYGRNYMHFFGKETDLLYLLPKRGANICVYDIPDDVLKRAKGFGKYDDFINPDKHKKVADYAVPSDEIELDYLKCIYLINDDLDYDHVPTKEEFYEQLLPMVDLTRQRTQTDGDEGR